LFLFLVCTYFLLVVLDGIHNSNFETFGLLLEENQNKQTNKQNTWRPFPSLFLLLPNKMSDHKAAVTLVTPGERVGHISEFNAGSGTYVKGGYIHASIVGAKTVVKSTDSEVFFAHHCNMDFIYILYIYLYGIELKNVSVCLLCPLDALNCKCDKRQGLNCDS
jgi:hypothetical protein